MRLWLLAAAMAAGLLLVAGPAEAANILAPIWFPGRSHFLMFRRLLEELAARGHNVTVLGHHPPKAPIPNYNFISVQGSMPQLHNNVGNPEHPAYTEQYEVPLKAPFSFWGRVYGTVMHQALRLLDWWWMDALLASEVRQVLGEDTPPLRQLLRDVSLVLVNSHWSVDQAAPTVPAFVEVGGLHVEQPRPLPDDLQQFLDDSPHGVIYFSLGSMVRIETFDADKLRAIVGAFAAAKQRVLWMADAASLPALPPHIKVRNWIPQNDVLNHPRVRLFITHGGLLGLQEAVAAGVPTLTLPLFSDQFINSARAVAAGSGLQLHYEDITERSFREALHTLLSDNRFRERAQHRSRLFWDRPRPPLEEAVYWVEYVIRHRGAPHLRSAALDLAWYQYLLLDVAAFLLAVSCCATAALYLAVKLLLLLRATSRGRKRSVKSKAS